ncbi:glutamate dehydrogenase [Sphingomonas sp. MAH-20]|uniref:Glutamate dehydrogenase n=1 Tax=Sphingomonas horti TaxID=2682842 RepID=A0A6I4IWD6_9SPHN|nr:MULTISPECIES: NAD-glutamate dehydrogenase domain-containing protein [Sphingomonas]MBA2920217.1 NAD-glutamate dehydrogenase [Sphingomonas sp. CGMCC 1.13658]MVO76472.1 glutamate dehydrogenase [Sphingomonas horti]
MATATRDRQETPDQQLISDISKALVKGALPGELDGFDGDAVAEAARFMAEAAAQRAPGTPSVRLESVGHGRRYMRLAIVNDDMPFLVDSVAGTVTAQELSIDRVLHPVVSVRRDADGRLIALDGGDGARRESMIYLEVERADARVRRAICDEIEAVLGDVRAAVQDWRAMQQAMKADADRMPEGEGAELLRWFLDNHFTQLGHEVRDRGNAKSDALGISRVGGREHLLAPTSLKRAFEWFEKGGEAPLLIKSNLVATVHRRTPLDLILLPVHEGGQVKALSIHAGLWTSAALATPPNKVPVLRSRLAALQDRYGFDPAGHAGKALTHAIATLPHDLLIAFTPNDLERLALTFMSLSDRPRPKLVTVSGALDRHVFAFVWLPREELTTARRVTIGRMLAQSADAKILNWAMALESGDLALIRYTLDIREGHVPDTDALDRRVGEMVRGWAPAIESTLAEHVDSGRAARLRLKYANHFPAYYRGRYTPAEAALDVLRLAELESPGTRAVRLHRLDRDGPRQLRLKIFNRGGMVPLSSAVPALENFGFRVMEEVPATLDEGLGDISDFLLELDEGQVAETLLARADVIEPAIAAVLSGAAENDQFNRLVVTNSMLPHEAVLFRAWFRYLRQTGLSYGLQTVVDALRRAPAVARGIIDLFDARHNPDNCFEGAADAALACIETGLAGVQAADDDRILRMIRGVVTATLRTNAYSPAAAEALAFKLDSHQVPGLPAPVPWREIWVYSPRVEGIHLRAGPVARGGLRWSDRRDDFRTEILGLMKAQRVKNAVIVPTGAKGGFFAKQLPNPATNRDAWLAEGTESYRIFIRSLLSVTDNIVAGEVVHPDRVVSRDGDDPYFVVAADKGTASFSDVANAIALERNFWLGDAFASGGSHGYDHKAMGITARGGWVSVRRHFAEMGIDVQTESVRVVGCGDMSGDVFGNGMLLSKATKLVAAFDHRHIFIDPDPDPAKSWAERDRLFNLPRSSWADYDEKLISRGGGVFPRTAKTITLSPEAQEVLGISTAEIEPAALISAILKSPVDLIWFGGIGTYVKARAESNQEVGDPANDALRVNGEDIRARVIGEGANLGVTQAGRIAFASHGGRINTDFIDNSAGVDCSDNEVNIKIALNREMNEGRLSFEDRNALLARMTDDVAELVLDDNRHQTLALSIAEAGATEELPAYVRLIETFEAAGRLDRAVEGIAANDELMRRAQENRGLTRPELAVLLSTAKLSLQDAIETVRLGDDPSLVPALLAAFPPEMRAGFATAVEQHQLRNEILATKIANRLINRLGVIHPFELAEEEGAALGDLAAAFVAAEQLYGLRALWEAIDVAPMTEAARIALLDALALGVRAQMADLLRSTDPGTRPGDIVARLGPGIARLDAKLEGLLEEEAQASSAALTQRLVGAGAPGDLVRQVARLYEMDGAVGLATLGVETNTDEVVLTRAFTSLGEALGLDWAQATANRLSPSDPWERLLAAGLARDFQQMRLDFLARAGGKDPQAYAQDWLSRQAGRVAQFRDLIHRARATTSPNAAMLAQVAGQARVLLGR